MSGPSKLKTMNARVDEWFRDHVILWWLIMATIPGGTYAGGQLLLNDGSVSRAVVLGAVFGAVFATITLGIQRWRTT